MNRTFTPESMSKLERSALVYAESCAVDGSGLMQGARINADDLQAFRNFQEHGLLRFGRVPAKLLGTVGGENYPNTHWVTLTDAGWTLAGNCRQLRSLQVGPNRMKVDAALAEMPDEEEAPVASPQASP